MKPQEFEKIVRAKTPVVESAPEPVVATTPAPVLEAMDLDSINQQYHALLGESSLHEFAPGGGGGDFMEYIKALARAWYTHDIRMLKDVIKKGGSPMSKIIDAQTAIEKMMARGIHCPDGKVRKYYIDYDSEFLGVDIASHDFYEYTDYGPDERGLNNVEIDERTGKPWGPYEHFEFKGRQLGEGVEEAVMTGGTEAYAMEDEQMDGMALGELRAIAQAAKKIYRSVKQGVPLEAWMYKKITNGNEGLAAVAQQIDNPAVREQQGVSEGQADQQHKVFKKNGEPVGEVGIDPEASPGNGNWYVKHYASGYDVVGFDSYEEAVEELKYCMKQGVAEGSSQSRLQPGTQVMLWLGPRDMLPNPPRDDKRYWDRGVVVDEPEMMTGSWQVLVKSERKGQSPISPGRVFVLKQQDVTEMDSQPPQGRIKSDGTRSHSTYGSRDGHSMTGPEFTGKATTPKKVIKKGTDILDRAFKDADKKDPNDPNWSKKYNKDVAEGQLDEIKQRLDPKCWKGKHKEGTKIKGGVRVNNCVPNESTDYAAQVNSLLNEFAGGVGAGSFASAPGKMQNPAKVGSLFGGSYSQKNSPFKKKTAKKESMIKRNGL